MSKNGKTTIDKLAEFGRAAELHRQEAHLPRTKGGAASSGSSGAKKAAPAKPKAPAKKPAPAKAAAPTKAAKKGAGKAPHRGGWAKPFDGAETVKVTVFIPVDDQAKLKGHAAKERITLSEAVSNLVRKHL